MKCTLIMKLCSYCIHGENGFGKTHPSSCCGKGEFDPKWCPIDKMKESVINYIVEMPIWCQCGKMLVPSYDGESVCPIIDEWFGSGNGDPPEGHDSGSNGDLDIMHFLMEQLDISMSDIDKAVRGKTKSKG